MEGSYAVHPQQFIGQSPFFYYTPDPNPENRQHGHFTQQPHGLPIPHALPSQDPVALYSQRPSTACSQTMMAQYTHRGIMTPVQSPQPMYQKPQILVHENEQYLFPLDTDCYAPSTPPLSSSGSAVSTPPSTAEILPTPMNAHFMGHTLESMKAGCEEEVFSEMLAGDNWGNAISPPMTPGKLQTNYSSAFFFSASRSVAKYKKVHCRRCVKKGVLRLIWHQCSSNPVLPHTSQGLTSFLPLNAHLSPHHQLLPQLPVHRTPSSASAILAT